MSKPENRQMLSDALAQPSMQMGRGLAQGMVAGTVETLGAGPAGEVASAAPGGRSVNVPKATGSPTKNGQATAVPAGAAAPAAVSRASTDLIASIGQGIDAEIKPRLEETVRSVVGSSMREAFAPPQRDAAAQLARQVAAAAADETMRHVAAGIRDEVGPAIQEVMTRNVGPALRTTVEQQVRPALQIDGAGASETLEKVAAETSRSVSREAVLGMHDALRDMGVVQTDGTLAPSVMGRPQGLIAGTLGIAGIIAIALGLVVVALIVWLMIATSRARRARDEARRHEADARRVSDVLRATRDRPWGRELETLLSDKLGPDALGPAAARPHAGQHAGGR